MPIIEDCAHAFGITVNGQPLGSRADAGVLSFYATKLIGAGEGGVVLTDSDELADFVRTWRDYADQPPDGTRLNDKMTDIEASLALCQLERLSDTIKRRQALAERYHTAFTDEADCTGLFRLPDQTRPRVWYRYAVSMRSQPATVIVEQLHRYGVRADIPVTDWRPHDGPPCPHAAEAYERVVSLPLYPTLTPHEQDRIIHAFLACCQEAAHV